MMTTIAAAPGQSQLTDPKIAKIWKSAQEFESMALGEMLKPMFATVDLSKSAFGGGEAEATFRPMLIDEVAKGIEKHGGLGLAVPVFHQMLHMQETADRKPK